MEANSAQSKQGRAIPTLGCFVPSLRNYYKVIWNGMAQVAEECNARLICFVGGELNSRTGIHQHWSVIYDLASSVSLDGLIVPSAGLQNFVTVEEMAQFCARYDPLPMVSIAQELEGIPSITIDNHVGLCEIMKHLIEAHHCQRIAFIRGPENNPEAEIRYHAYIESLEKHNITFDPDLVALGNFNSESGTEAVRLFLDRRKASFDAVVASNDSMAFGVWQELTNRGFNVPEDVAIAGFDDVPEAKAFIATPLTTVRQPLVEQGQQAARMLLEHLRHGTPLDNLTLKTRLVVRESCGCSPFVVSGPASPPSRAPTDISKSALARQRETTLAEMQKALCPYFPRVTPHSIEQLVDAFFDELQGKPDAQFLQRFSHVLRTGSMQLSREATESEDMARWQEALSILREQAQLYTRPDAAMRIEDILHQGRILIADVVERIHANQLGRTEVNTMIRFDVIRDLSIEPDIRSVVDSLAQNLPRLGVHTCFLALYEGTPIPPPVSRLIMAYDNGQKLELEPGGRLFPTLQVIPPDLLPDNKPPFLMIHPLGLHSSQFGFIVMDIDIERQTIPAGIYEEFSDQIGAALYRALLLQQIEQSNKDLQQRAAELAEANTQLEQFAYIASHDLQEPLRMVTSYLNLLERRYRDRLDTDAQEFIAYAVDGAMRMKRLINDLLTYSRVATHNRPNEATDCDLLLTQALSNLEVAIKENNALISHDPLPTVLTDGTQLMGVFQNLIGNAIKFHADRQPQIHISAQQAGDEWLFSVRDNGIGIAPEHTEQIFAIFNRLHPRDKYPGTGIGLAICKKVVERHGGRIWVESQPGEGATFFFTLPNTEMNGKP
ncbi:MAG: substrate-binding domain-containing protein [Anaerolineae bacterium]|nr:substrate-binding domain-containing protein [Anaerolineae bacterium]